MATGPQLTWSVVISAIGAFCVLTGGGYTIIQNQFNAVARRIDTNEKDIQRFELHYLTLREHAAFQREQEAINIAVADRIKALETAQREIISHSARSPIESREMDQLSSAFDKRFEGMQQQINDINRQIAASILLHPSPPALKIPNDR